MTKSTLEQCAVCGSLNMTRIKNAEIEAPFRTATKIKKIKLTGVSFDKCLDCGEEYLNAFDCELHDQKLREALEAERKRKNLLTADEIKEIRESLGYSQTQLEKLLGFGSKSFARWETYRADQSKAADLLLRAIKQGGKKLLQSLIDDQKPKAA
jgi:putative zinc finger/helix-turn-helix YgiT family protein